MKFIKKLEEEKIFKFDEYDQTKYNGNVLANKLMEWLRVQFLDNQDDQDVIRFPLQQFLEETSIDINKFRTFVDEQDQTKKIKSFKLKIEDDVVVFYDFKNNTNNENQVHNEGYAKRYDEIRAIYDRDHKPDEFSGVPIQTFIDNNIEEIEIYLKSKYELDKHQIHDLSIIQLIEDGDEFLYNWAMESGVEVGDSNDDKREVKRDEEEEQRIIDYNEWENNRFDEEKRRQNG